MSIQTPTTVSLEQQDHATLVTGSAQYGRIRFVAQIEDADGLGEEVAIASAISDGLQEAIDDA
ncbi:MAG: hypothetical protein ABEJ76_08875 [Halanaeroarchaeum sp.]